MSAWLQILLAAAGTWLASLVASEAKGWLPTVIAWLLDRATKRLPDGKRERLREEWAAAINEIPTPFSRLVFALGLQIAASRIRRQDQRIARLAGTRANLDVPRPPAVRPRPDLRSLGLARLTQYWFGSLFNDLTGPKRLRGALTIALIVSVIVLVLVGLADAIQASLLSYTGSAGR